MKTLLKLLFLFTIIISCQDKQLEAENIISKAIFAYGGEDAMRGIKTKKEKGTSTIYLQDTIFRTSNYVQYFKSPNKTYYESPVTKELKASKLIFASNGTKSWTQNDGALAPYVQPDEEVTDLKGEDYPYLFTLKERGVTVLYIDKIVEDDLVLHHLYYNSEDGLEEDVYFDDKTGLIAKTYRVIQTSIGQAEIFKTFSDYNNVSGIAIAFKTESFFPPKERNVYVIDELEINKPVNDSHFEFPKLPKLSSKEIDGIVGIFQSEDIKIIVSKNENELAIQKDDFQNTKLLIVKNNFFMFRIGEKEKSHVENIFIEEENEEIVQKIKLINKEGVYILNRLE